MQITGLRVTKVASSEWAQKLGFQPGDVVTAINGKPVLDPRNIQELVQEIMGAPGVVFEMEHQGADPQVGTGGVGNIFPMTIDECKTNPNSRQFFRHSNFGFHRYEIE